MEDAVTTPSIFVQSATAVTAGVVLKVDVSLELTAERVIESSKSIFQMPEVMHMVTSWAKES